MWQAMFPHRPVWSAVARILFVVPLATFMMPMIPASADTTAPVHLALQFPPGSGSAPKRTAGAGVRGNCAPGLTAIIPDTSVSKTVNEDTKFFVYIPQTDALIGRFTLNLSADGSHTYTEDVLLSGQPGVATFTLPKEITLAMNNPYAWKFTLYCDGVPSTTLANGTGAADQRVSSVSGQVQRVALTPEQQAKLKAAKTPLEKATVYASAGVWHEAMAILSGLRSTQPQEWKDTLHSIGLDSISQAPFVD